MLQINSQDKDILSSIADVESAIGEVDTYNKSTRADGDFGYKQTNEELENSNLSDDAKSTYGAIREFLENHREEIPELESRQNREEDLVSNALSLFSMLASCEDLEELQEELEFINDSVNNAKGNEAIRADLRIDLAVEILKSNGIEASNEKKPSQEVKSPEIEGQIQEHSQERGARN